MMGKVSCYALCLVCSGKDSATLPRDPEPVNMQSLFANVLLYYAVELCIFSHLKVKNDMLAISAQGDRFPCGTTAV